MNTTQLDNGQPSGCPFSKPKDFIPWAPEFVQNPYPTFKWLRSLGPVAYSEAMDYWVVNSRDAIKEILMDEERFSANLMLSTMTKWPEDVARELAAVIPDRPMLKDLDGEPHEKARRFLRFAFTPRRLEWIREDVERIADDCLDSLFADGDGSGDIVRRFTDIAPIRVLMKFLGIPDDMGEQIRAWSHNREDMLQGNLTEEELRAGVQPLKDYYAYARQRIEELEANPGDDYMSEVIQLWKEEQPDNVVWDDVLNILMSLMNAGHATTSDLFGNGLWALLTHREQWDKLCADPDLVPEAIEEMLRWETSVPAWRRRALVDLEIEGHHIPAGSKMFLLLGSGNRDESVVSDGELFDIERTDGRQYLTFSAGAHYCLGQSLAKLELNTFFRRLVARYPQLELREGYVPDYRVNAFHRGPNSLPVELGPEPLVAGAGAFVERDAR
ncbi:cytochrome P450 [Paeniglutamicibacter kerguelensis]|uniref:Cytochrome P450 n=1 Tax=Paeniglutamicibacter kerguelensis TaxID=254788 RepID=A0ABS4X837_9MICC|nr:cytochrome P450 [Paeniglutamicibacter kerguelensis]MBP2384630.1 cytochrome P450 [Paeniglutamicibacter kerguelensis]